MIVKKQRNPRRRKPKVRAEDLARIFRLGEALVFFRFTLEESLSPVHTVRGEIPFEFERNLIRKRWIELMRHMVQVRRSKIIDRSIWPELHDVVRRYYAPFAALTQVPPHLPPEGLGELCTQLAEAPGWVEYERVCQWLSENLPDPFGRMLRLSLLVSKVRHPLPLDRSSDRQQAFDEEYLRFELYPALGDLRDAILAKSRLLVDVLSQPSNRDLGETRLYDHTFGFHGAIQTALEKKPGKSVSREVHTGRPSLARSSDPKDQIRCNIYRLIAAEAQQTGRGAKTLLPSLKVKRDLSEAIRQLDEKLDAKFVRKALGWSRHNNEETNRTAKRVRS